MKYIDIIVGFGSSKKLKRSIVKFIIVRVKVYLTIQRITSILSSWLLYLKVKDTNLNLICLKSTTQINYDVWKFR